jgi:protease-4
MLILLGGGGLVLLVFLMLGSMLGGLFGGGIPGGPMAATDHGPRLVEIIKEEGDSDERILVIPMEGIITSAPLESVGHSMVDLLKHQLEKAADEDSIKAVILKVDSPGGEVLASDDMYQLLKEFQEKHRKPIIASMANLAASGGYYVSAPCRWIVANELTITGSIGVIMHGFNYRGLMDKVGIRPEVFKSGKFKDMLSGDKREEEISQEERAMVQRMVNETFDRFKAVVAEGRQRANKLNADEKEVEDRGRTLVPDWMAYADGRILSGKEALRHGFVDELGNFQTAVERTMQIAGLRRPELVEYQPVLDFSHLFRLFGDAKARPVKVDLGLEKSKLRSGYMYFIWPMAVN